MTDILSVQPQHRTLVVKHPGSDEPIGLDITYRSMDSEEVQSVERAIRTKALRGGRNVSSVERIEEGEYSLLHAAVVSWRWYNGMTLGEDSNPAASRANTEKLFRSVPWIKKQFNRELGDEAGFFSNALKASSNSSSGE